MRHALASLLLAGGLATIWPDAAAVPPAFPRQAVEVAEQALTAGRLAEAERRFRPVLDLVDTGTRNDLPFVGVLNGLATAVVLQGRGGESRALFERALRIQNHADELDPTVLARTLHGLARSHLLLGDTAAARRLLLRELPLREASEFDDPLALARTLRGLGRIHVRHGEHAAARRLASRETQLYDEALDHGLLEVPALLEQVRYDADREEPASPFRTQYLRAVALSAEPLWKHDRVLADGYRAIARFYRALGDSDAALDWQRQAWFERGPEGFVQGVEAYSKLATRKALAFAVDANGRWTFSFRAGEPVLQDAIDGALEDCRRRLPWHRIEADCEVYALDDEVVWALPSPS